ncbi:hypothetical protein ACIRST_33825 [Kitasatospora sp. NPDC101447]|uniref:hypothetical protein n=1 Tax=Kitasatospora sp. NPDC101447 TaxID=3364102 RepID=UPI00381D23B2
MPYQSVPPERLKVLQGIVDGSPHAPRGLGLSCDDIKSRMDAYLTSSFEDPEEGAAYFIWFLIAIISGCDFIWNDVNDPYWIDVSSGKPFQLQMAHPEWDNRGCKLMMYDDDIPALFSDNMNRKGDYDPSQDVHNLFHAVPVGYQLEGRDAYYIFVQDGAHSGKSLTSYWDADAGDRKINALEHDPATADRWTVSDNITVGGCGGRAIDNYDAQGNHQGRMDVPQGKGGHPILVWPDWNGDYNQIFQLRPTVYENL